MDLQREKPERQYLNHTSYRLFRTSSHQLKCKEKTKTPTH